MSGENSPNDPENPTPQFKTTDARAGYGAQSSTFEQACKGLAEDSQADNATLNGDNMMNSSRPRVDVKQSLMDGPFGGKKPQS
jgi:hypothetical protein